MAGQSHVWQAYSFLIKTNKLVVSFWTTILNKSNSPRNGEKSNIKSKRPLIHSMLNIGLIIISQASLWRAVFKMFTRLISVLFLIKICYLLEISSQVLPGCRERCGSVRIPYPFGIGPNCSAHDTYSITCNTSFSPPRPFITNINLEVLEISLDGTARVNTPLLTYNCSSRTDRLDVNFTNTPFTYSSTSTRFTAIGCNNLALISRLTTVIGGCLSLCNFIVPDNTCYGILCCQTNIPPSLKFINASLGSIESTNDQNGCK